MSCCGWMCNLECLLVFYVCKWLKIKIKCTEKTLNVNNHGRSRCLVFPCVGFGATRTRSWCWPRLTRGWRGRGACRRPPLEDGDGLCGYLVLLQSTADHQRRNRKGTYLWLPAMTSQNYQRVDATMLILSFYQRLIFYISLRCIYAKYKHMALQWPITFHWTQWPITSRNHGMSNSATIPWSVA